MMKHIARWLGLLDRCDFCGAEFWRWFSHSCGDAIGLGLDRAAALAALALLLTAHGWAQYTPPYVGLVGTLGSANGMPASNYIITLEPSQVMYVGGTSIVVANTNCGTDNNGHVVGTPNPTAPAVLAANPASGTLPAGNYYVEITWYDNAGHQTLGSPEATVQLTAPGNVTISPPVGGAPLPAVGMYVYIGTTSGGETYQGAVSNPTGSFIQSIPLVTGATPPIANNSVCVTVANDAAWPIGGYSFNLTTPAGNTVPGYPQQVQFVGPGSAFNVSNGLPLWNGRVTYPVPILTLPYNHNAQSISGPLSMTNYNVYNVHALGVATANPAWGVDVEGSGAYAAINANQGYLVSGTGGTAGQCLGSDGTYWDTPINCTAGGTIYYQYARQNGSALPQEEAYANGPGITFSNVLGPPGVTQVAVETLANTGVDTYVAMYATAGTSGTCAAWDANGGLGPGTCTVPYTGASNYQNIGGGLILMWGYQNAAAGGPTAITVTWPVGVTCSTFEKVLSLATVDYGTNPSRNVAYITAESLTGFTGQTDSSTAAFNWSAICK